MRWKFIQIRFSFTLFSNEFSKLRKHTHKRYTARMNDAQRTVAYEAMCFDFFEITNKFWWKRRWAARSCWRNGGAGFHWIKSLQKLISLPHHKRGHWFETKFTYSAFYCGCQNANEQQLYEFIIIPFLNIQSSICCHCTRLNCQKCQCVQIFQRM